MSPKDEPEEKNVTSKQVVEQFRKGQMQSPRFSADMGGKRRKAGWRGHHKARGGTGDQMCDCLNIHKL